ncbi:eukaryotic translation elongation factor 1 epsilon-1-like [Ixodes scapularis]|uniref:eukaryotic translation elongation factor 1 epsilon-1-like n=1 Tax=Ixodes scapularis TaxID=6945 RepID=UPI001A9D5A6E|nr:eukaryotic translation elongation factor 1 epsilon-1-like [Ixodes scapularis]
MAAHMDMFLRFLDVKPESVNLQIKKKVPKTTTESGQELTGCAPISRYFAEQSAKDKEIWGKTPQDRAEIQQWLEYRALHLDEVVPTQEAVHEILQELNCYMGDRTYFVGNGLTVADIFMYYSLHSYFVALTFRDKERYHHLSRWLALTTDPASTSTKSLRSFLPEYPTTRKRCEVWMLSWKMLSWKLFPKQNVLVLMAKWRTTTITIICRKLFYKNLENCSRQCQKQLSPMRKP